MKIQSSKNQIDLNDLNYVEKQKGLVLSSFPCPQDKRTGKINPHVSQFSVLGAKHGEKVSVFHVKPVYYEHVSSTDENLVFRPMYEVCTHYGNHLVIFDHTKLLLVHPRYIEWLRKRMKLINGEVLVTSPFSVIPSPYNFVHEMVHSSIAKPKIGMTVTTVYPDPDTETTTVDGAVANDRSTLWATTHDATSASNDQGLGGAFPSRSEPANWTEGIFSYQYQAGNRTVISRGFFLFDTSSINDTDTVSAATFSWYVLYELDYSDNTSQEYVALVSSTPASNTDLVVGDYDQCGDAINNPTKGASDLTNASVSLNAYNDWALNATGLGWITKTGVTKLGLREGHDVEDVVPTYSTDTNDVYSVAGRFADYTGTSSDPKLVVTHAGSSVSVTVTPTTLAATLAFIAETAKTNYTFADTTKSSIFSIPTYTVISGSLNYVASTVVATLSTIAHTAKSNVTVVAETFGALFTTIGHLVAQSITVTTAVVTATMTVVTLVHSGLRTVWARVSRNASGAWTRITRNDD